MKFNYIDENKIEQKIFMKFRYRKQNTSLLLIIAFFFHIGCNNNAKPKTAVPVEFQELENLVVYSEDVSPTKEISFTKAAVYGDNEDVLIGRIGSIAVDDLSRVFIADVQRQVINVFGPDGELITELGRQGRGPGEFGFIKRLHIRNNSLHVFDSRQGRVSVVNLETLDFKNTLVLAQNKRDLPVLNTAEPFVDEIYVRNDESYLVKFKMDNRNNNSQLWMNFDFIGAYYVQDANGRIISEEILKLDEAIGTNISTPSSNAVLSFHLKQFFGNKLITTSKEDLIYVAEPDHFLVKVYNSDGSYLNSFFYPIQKFLFTEESAKEAKITDGLIEIVKSVDLPENWPALVDMKLDNQNRLWIVTTVENMENYGWWVLEDSGELITRFEWTRDKPIEYIHNNYIYTKETEEITSNEVVVRYKIEFEDLIINQ